MASISIIVPLYNEGKGASDILNHLEAVCGWQEAILVDASDDPHSLASFDAAKEYSAELFGGDSRQINMVTTSKRGRASQMNRGARNAIGDILLFLHCDTRLPAGALERVRAELPENQGWGRFDVRLDAPGISMRIIENMINLRSRVRALATGDQAIFVSRELFESCGGFSETQLMEDISISKKLAVHSRPALVTIPVHTSARRWRNRGVVGTVLLMWRLRFLNWIGVSDDYLKRQYSDER